MVQQSNYPNTESELRTYLDELYSTTRQTLECCKRARFFRKKESYFFTIEKEDDMASPKQSANLFAN